MEIPTQGPVYPGRGTNCERQKCPGQWGRRFSSSNSKRDGARMRDGSLWSGELGFYLKKAKNESCRRRGVSNVVEFLLSKDTETTPGLRRIQMGLPLRVFRASLLLKTPPGSLWPCDSSAVLVWTGTIDTTPHDWLLWGLVMFCGYAAAP